MLSNAYFLAKFRFDTAENEPAKNLQNLQNLLIFNFVNFPNFARLVPELRPHLRGPAAPGVVPRRVAADPLDHRVAEPARTEVPLLRTRLKKIE